MATEVGRKSGEDLVLEGKWIRFSSRRNVFPMSNATDSEVRWGIATV